MGFLLKKPADVAGSSAPAIMIGLFVAFGGVLYGYDTGTIGGIIAMKYWLKTFSTGYTDANGNPAITSSQSSQIVSILSAGTFFGSLAAGFFADKFGRRIALMMSTVVFCLGVALQTAADAIPLFTAGRFFAGLGVGLISAMIPMYQSETSPKWIRGTVVGAYQLAITIGLFLAAIVDNATKHRDDSGSYRIPIAIQFAWAIILVIGLIILPETPRWLVKQDRHDDAIKSLSKLRRLPTDHPALQEELAEIEANHQYDLASSHKSSYKDFLQWNSLGKRLMTGCALQALQQLTGVNFIFYYGTSFFSNSGINNPFIISIITDVVNVSSTFPGLYLVEKWGRRKLLLFGAAGMFTCQMIVASVGTAFPGAENIAAQRALIAFVCFYIFFFASTWGPVAWVVTGEIFPLHVRGKGLSLTTASNWLLNWAIAYSTPYMVDSGPGNADLKAKVFFVWGGFCGLCFLFVYMFIYETKGLSLEEVDELYDTVAHAWQSKGFVPTVDYAKAKNDEGGMASADHVEEKGGVLSSEAV